MAMPFVRIDLSSDSRDFEQTTLVMGLPLLDDRNSQYLVLKKWLGARVAEPERVRTRDKDEVCFYLRSPAGARLEKVECYQVTEKDLEGGLKGELEALVQAIGTAVASSADESRLLDAVKPELVSLQTDPRRKFLRCSNFFKYQDHKKVWRLVWCPGYRRKDSDRALPLICTSSKCLHLFVMKGGSRKCPYCMVPPPPPPPGGQRRRLRQVIVVLLLMGLTAVLGDYFVWHKFLKFPAEIGQEGGHSDSGLVIMPDTWTGPVGSQVPFQVAPPASGDEPATAPEVSLQTDDPRVMAVDEPTLVATAKEPGKATLTFQSGALARQVVCTVETPENPQKLSLEPGKVELSVGSTARLKLMGEYGDNRIIDLTDSAEWSAASNGIFYVYQGLLEGLEEGKATITARYRATSTAQYMEAAADVTVTPEKYKSLALEAERTSFAVGQVTNLKATATTESGQDRSVLESSMLSLKLEPANVAELHGSRVYGLQPGAVKLTGTFHGMSDTLDLTITAAADTAGGRLDVSPKEMQLFVGEIAELSIRAPKPDHPLRVVSSSPEIVQVNDSNRLVGRAEGDCQIDVAQGDQVASVKVVVKSAEYSSLRIAPERISVRVDDHVDFRVMGKVEGRDFVELSPEVLEWVNVPSPERATLDKSTLRVRGVRPTEDVPEILAARLASHEVRAELEVLAAPLRLELSADGPVEIPVGQMLPLKVRATYGGTQPEEIAVDRVEFKAEPVEGLTILDGAVHSLRAGAGPLKITASYQNSDSNELAVSSVAAVPLSLKLDLQPVQVRAGDVGAAILSGESPTGPVTLSPLEVRFESSNPEVLAVDRITGGFRGLKVGTAAVSAIHPAANQPARAEVAVVEAAKEQDQPPPKEVYFVTLEPQPVRIIPGAELPGLRVEALENDGLRHDITADATLQVEGDAVTAAVSVVDGQITTKHPGEASVSAEYRGVVSTNPLRVVVLDDLKIDELRISPAPVKIAVDETMRLAAVGYLKGGNVGILGNPGSLTFETADSGAADVLRIDGHVLTGLKPGAGKVIAKWKDISSRPVDVTVVETTEQIPERLQLVPESLELVVGETRALDRAIKLTRAGVDVTHNATVSSASPDVVRFDDELRALVGASPGGTRVAFSFGGQLAYLDVKVRPSEVAAEKDLRLNLSPSGGELHVGQRLQVQGFEQCESCQHRATNRTASLVLTSSDPGIIAVDGTTLIGVKPGMATVTGRLPGVEAPAEATFTVVDTKFSRLVVEPPRFRIATGQRRKYAVYAIDENGRTAIGNHPDLQVTVEGRDPQCIEVDTGGLQVRGVSPGEAALAIRWRELPPQQIPVTVVDLPVQAIRIEPAESSIAQGEHVDYQIFAKRGEEWLPLSNADEIKLSVSNPSVAQATSGWRVVGMQPGATRVVARHGRHRATSALKVSLPSKPPAPAAQVVGLRFLPDVFRVQLGTPGDSIRVVRVYADGKQEDVDHLATLTVREPSDVIAIDKTASGPIVRPKKIGQTQVDAALGELRTPKPLLVDVVDSLPQQAWLQAVPSPLRLSVGESKPFNRVQVIPARGGVPIEVPFTIKASPTPIFEIDSEQKAIRGLKDGSAVVTVAIDDPNGKYDGLHTSVMVQVGDVSEVPGADTPSGDDGSIGKELGGARLVLDGPTETSVGAEISLNAEISDGTSGRSVTNEVRLSTVAGEVERAELRSGCQIFAKKPGTLKVQASHKGMVSNIHEIHIHDAAADFGKLELEFKSSPPMAVGETRQYTLWGYPRGGGPRQDLTSRVSSDPQDKTRPRLQVDSIEPAPTADVVLHRPPELVAKGPGAVRVQAHLGDQLQSDAIDVQVAKDLMNQPVQIQILPQKVVVREKKGDQVTTPEFQVQVRLSGADAFRPIDNATLESLDVNILAPDPGNPRRFIAVRPGTTRVRASFGGKVDSAEVVVIPDRFGKIQAELAEMGRDRFSLALQVAGSLSNEKLEYRIVVPDSGEGSEWTPATVANNEVHVRLKSPYLAFGQKDQIYRLHIEARNTLQSDTAERYPYSFRLRPSDVEEQK